MSKANRLKDSIDYLLEQSRTRLNWLSEQEVNLLNSRVLEQDLIQGGNNLSLGWSWYNSRPAKDVRKAIRAYVMISIYNGDINAAGAGGLATQLKNVDETVIHNDLKLKIRDYCAKPTIRTEAVEYSCQTKGGGQRRASATAIGLGDTVTHIMARRKDDPGMAVMLIDMQSDGNVDASREHDGKSVLGHIGDVLDAAKLLNTFVVYDIVVDPSNKGNVSTILTLKLKMPNETKYRSIVKPSYNSFQNTTLAQMLVIDKIKTVIVMGTDANLCVKNTIFGTPEYEEATKDKRPMTEKERLEFITLNPQYRDLSVNDFNKAKSLSVTKKVDYLEGLLDRGIRVITSRCILDSVGVLEQEYAKIAGI